MTDPRKLPGLEPLRHVGRDRIRPDARAKALGQAEYIHDIERPGMLHGQVVFSAHPHARILHIDTSRAERLPGVRAVITAANTPEIRIGFLRDNPVLKGGKVRALRDEVAAVAATDPEIAREAAALIDVIYEPLPAVFDPRAAMLPDAPLVHETDGRGRPVTSNLLPVRFRHDSGDLAAARRASAHIAEGTYTTPLIQQSCMGTAGCLAEFDPSGNLRIQAKTQIPFLAQRDFGRALGALGLGGRNVRVTVPALGGGFGTGLDTHAYEYISILLAWRTGRPVKVLYSREEEFSALSPRQSSTVHITQGCDAEGRLTFRRVRVLQDNGAYGGWGATYPSVMLLPATSLYRVDCVSFDAEIVYTNNTWAQAMRGYGNPELTWALESNLDELARRAGVDALAMRRLNCNRSGEVTPMGLKVGTCGLAECLDGTAERLDWPGKRGRQRHLRRGVGLASLMHVGGSGRIYRSDGSGVILRFDDYGNVYVYSGGVEMGQGLHAALTAATAEAVGVLPEQVFINQTDTATCPWDVGTHASRGAFVACNAVQMAARALRAELLGAAAEVWPELVGPPGAGATAGDLDLVDGLVTARDQADQGGQSGPAVPLGKLLRALHFREGGRMFTAQAFYEPPSELPDWSKGIGNMSATYAYGVQGVEVEVDVETGDVRICKLVAVHDVGRVLCPQALRGQTYGALAQGLGYALTEQVHTHEGRILNPGFTDYKIPTAEEMGIPIELAFVELGDEEGPFGAKGVGEPGLVPTAPAIANAIYDAVGVRVRDLPITPEKLLAAIREASHVSK